jgi:RNA polymerase sigma-70 factor (ECF subfamily)
MATSTDGDASEVALLRSAASGEPTAVRGLLDLTGAVVYGFVVGRVGVGDTVAEDLVQETFLEAMRSAHTFRGEAALSTWMCAIARRRVARHFAAERRRQATRAELPPVGDVVDDTDAVDERQRMLAALRRLPVLHRQVLVFKYLDGLSVEEIASDVGRSRVQVQSLLQRARDGLRRHLGETDG